MKIPISRATVSDKSDITTINWDKQQKSLPHAVPFGRLQVACYHLMNHRFLPENELASPNLSLLVLHGCLLNHFPRHCYSHRALPHHHHHHYCRCISLDQPGGVAFPQRCGLPWLLQWPSQSWDGCDEPAIVMKFLPRM